jgi:hypothetical protein
LGTTKNDRHIYSGGSFIDVLLRDAGERRSGKAKFIDTVIYWTDLPHGTVKYDDTSFAAPPQTGFAGGRGSDRRRHEHEPDGPHRACTSGFSPRPAEYEPAGARSSP